MPAMPNVNSISAGKVLKIKYNMHNFETLYDRIW